MEETNVERPLLEKKKKKKYYENCPGCKVDEAKELSEGRSVLFTKLFVVWMLVLCASLPISSLFPFVYFMVRDFNIAKTEADISFYAGYLGSVYMLGRCLTSLFWGTIADRIGRKPAYTTELLREEHQALGLSTVSSAWGVGLVIGPALGGYLSKPVEKYPQIFPKDSFWDKFPYFLPSFVMSALAFVVAIGCIWIPETLHKHNCSDESIDDAKALENGSSGGGIEKIQKNENLFLNWPLMSSIIPYCIFSLLEVAYLEVFSLWAVSPQRLGGLNFTTDDVGNVLSISGLSLIIYQIGIYPSVEKATGPISVARVSSILTIPLLQSYPFIALLSGLALYIVLSMFSILRNILSITITTGLILLQNRAVKQHQRGAANGIAMTCMSLFNAIGPAAGGTMRGDVLPLLGSGSSYVGRGGVFDSRRGFISVMRRSPVVGVAVAAPPIEVPFLGFDLRLRVHFLISLLSFGDAILGVKGGDDATQEGDDATQGSVLSSLSLVEFLFSRGAIAIRVSVVLEDLRVFLFDNLISFATSDLGRFRVSFHLKLGLLRSCGLIKLDGCDTRFELRQGLQFFLVYGRGWLPFLFSDERLQWFGDVTSGS
ncbi:Protein ZINC INDUCED FACILITATOR 1 [Vigna angularis]|uniref:Protein ZINC INDUCED FACILITATOR 1 n=1 Tax=Phaseolus angularis TaxID=3914 RepID=A0A8T0KAE2_PHAAN|nr:Protein ZINC INDUCED FACILITATOR 1 [Vigna angularis]